MNKTLKVTAVAALALTALAAHAGTGLLLQLQVTKGQRTGGIGELRQVDSRFFRIKNQTFGNGDVDWNCTFFGLGNPTGLSHVEIKVTGSHLGARPMNMFLFDHIALRWTHVGIVSLPTIGSGDYFLRIRRAPERFVSASGIAKVRFQTSFQTMIIDKVSFRSVR